MIDWLSTSKLMGYDDDVEMWRDLYESKSLSISQLSRKLGVSRNVVRACLEKAGIKKKKRGGPNNTRCVVTDEMVEEIRRDGISAVAKRLGLDYTTLYKKLKRVRGLTPKDLRVLPQPLSLDESEPPGPGEEPDHEDH